MVSIIQQPRAKTTSVSIFGSNKKFKALRSGNSNLSFCAKNGVKYVILQLLNLIFQKYWFKIQVNCLFAKQLLRQIAFLQKFFNYLLGVIQTDWTRRCLTRKIDGVDCTVVPFQNFSIFLSAAIGQRPRNYLSCCCCSSCSYCSPFGSFPH